MNCDPRQKPPDIGTVRELQLREVCATAQVALFHIAPPTTVPALMSPQDHSLALIEIGNLGPTLLVVDRCAKAAGVRIVGIEGTGAAEQCIKLLGSTDAVRAAAEAGVELGKQMGTFAAYSMLPNPRRNPRTQPAAARMVAHVTAF